MVVLLTDKLDKSEVEYQGSYDDVVEVAVLFDVRSGRSFCVTAVCTEVIEDLSLWSQFAAHVHSICGVCGFVNVHLAEFSLQGRLGCGSRARCLLFFSVRQRVL